MLSLYSNCFIEQVAKHNIPQYIAWYVCPFVNIMYERINLKMNILSD